MSPVRRTVKSWTQYTVSFSFFDYDTRVYNPVVMRLPESSANSPNIALTVDVPMNRVKFNVNTEYNYLNNFKVLQSELHLDQTNPPHPPGLTEPLTMHLTNRPAIR